MRRVIQNYIEEGLHTGKRELLALTEDIGVYQAAKSCGMMSSGVASVANPWSLILDLWSSKASNWCVYQELALGECLSGSNPMHYQEDNNFKICSLYAQTYNRAYRQRTL